MTSFDDLLKRLHIDNTYTKAVKKEKVFTKVKDQVPLRKHLNYQADILFLPTTKEKYKYLLVVVDLATNYFDIEPMKTKTAKETLESFKKMFSRPYIKLPLSSIRTDAGKEFEGDFNKWMYDESILHTTTKPGRHKQLANINYLCRQLGEILNGYMNEVEIKTGEAYREWTDVLDDVRRELNYYRVNKEALKKSAVYKKNDVTPNVYNVKPKFKKGEYVYVKLDIPKSALNKEQSTHNFRVGDIRWDLLARQVKKVLVYSGKIPYRYVVDGIPNVAYTEAELRTVPENKQVQKYVIKQILAKKKILGKMHYLVHWKGYPKNEATWEPEETLLEDAGALIKAFNKEH
jgi:hypothetical protein